MSAHDQLSPSARHRWGKCAASVRACLPYLKEGGKSSPSAIDGTHSHTLLEHCLKHHGDIADPGIFIGTILGDHEGSFSVDKARADRVRVAVNYIRERALFAKDIDVLSEQRVDPASLVQRKDMSGTVDVQLREPTILEVIDYKDGYKPVIAEGNPQLQQYAVGVLAEYMNTNTSWPDHIRLTVIQPKSPPDQQIVSHIYTLAEVLGFAVDMSLEAGRTDDPNAPFTPGESQCSYCPHAGACQAHIDYSLSKAGVKFGAVEVAVQGAKADPHTMSDEQLRELVEGAPLIRKMLEMAEAEALTRITAGHPIGGLKVVHGPGRRAWKLDEEGTAKRLTMMGIPKSAVWKLTLVSPAQVEKLSWESKGEQKQLSERQLKTLTNEYITKSEGKLTVVPEADWRPSAVTGELKFEAVPAKEPEWFA